MQEESKVEELQVENQAPPQTTEVIETPPPEPAKEPLAQEQSEEPVVAPPPPPALEPEPIPEPAPQIEEVPPPTFEPVPTPPIREEPLVKIEDSGSKIEEAATTTGPVATPPIVPTPLPVVDTLETTPPLAPAVHDPKYLKDVPVRVLELTEEEINAARKLWAREHIGAAQVQANKSRNVRMNQRMNEIEKIVKTKPNVSVHTIANSVQLSQKLTSGYLQKLVHGGRVKASGNTGNRRFY